MLFFNVQSDVRSLSVRKPVIVRTQSQQANGADVLAGWPLVPYELRSFACGLYARTFPDQRLSGKWVECFCNSAEGIDIPLLEHVIALNITEN